MIFGYTPEEPVAWGHLCGEFPPVPLKNSVVLRKPWHTQHSMPSLGVKQT